MMQKVKATHSEKTNDGLFTLKREKLVLLVSKWKIVALKKFAFKLVWNQIRMLETEVRGEATYVLCLKTQGPSFELVR